jgi:hypothetical protein
VAPGRLPSCIRALAERQSRRGSRALWGVVALGAGAALAGCGGSGGSTSTGVRATALDRSYIPLPFGRGPAYRPGAASIDVALAKPVDGLKCSDVDRRPRFGAHIELFAHRRVIAIPAGIGVAPPLEHNGAYVTAGRCSYPLRTLAPSGVIELAPGPVRTVGTFFDVWGQALTAQRMLSFTRPVAAFVDGQRYTGDPRSIPLVRHAQVVLEVGGFVPPHPIYRFPPGL